MAKDFVTPEQYQRGVGKIKNYVDSKVPTINDSEKYILRKTITKNINFDDPDIITINERFKSVTKNLEITNESLSKEYISVKIQSDNGITFNKDITEYFIDGAKTIIIDKSTLDANGKPIYFILTFNRKAIKTENGDVTFEIDNNYCTFMIRSIEMNKHPLNDYNRSKKWTVTLSYYDINSNYYQKMYNIPSNIEDGMGVGSIQQKGNTSTGVFALGSKNNGKGFLLGSSNTSESSSCVFGKGNVCTGINPGYLFGEGNKNHGIGGGFTLGSGNNVEGVTIAVGRKLTTNEQKNGNAGAMIIGQGGTLSQDSRFMISTANTNCGEIRYPFDAKDNGDTYIRGKNVFLETEDEITNEKSIVNKKYVDDKVAGIVDSAPETLDTLQELATALGNDPNFATTVVTKIGKKVDKVEGMSLTHNDLTNELKANYDAAYNYSQAKHSYNDLTDKPSIPSIDGLATESYVDDKTSMENVIYEGNGTGPDVISDYWTGCPVSKGNGCWVINKQIEFDSSKPNPYYLLCDTTLYSPENSTFDATNSAWIYAKVPNTGTIFICNKYNGENKLVLPWDDVNTPGKIKLYTKTELAKAMFSGDYNDLSNKPTIPSIEGLATEEYVNNKVTDTATSLTNDPDIYLTKDKYQYVTGVNTVNNMIWLPSTDLPAFLKIHVYTTNCKMQCVFDTPVKWKIGQNPNEGTFKIVTDNIYEFILTYINGSWIGEVVTYSNTEYTPTNDADVTTKKYVDNLTVQATSDEVKNMLNTTLGGDYSGEN